MGGRNLGQDGGSENNLIISMDYKNISEMRLKLI